MIFGENLLALMVLALGGALAVGTVLALIRPKPVDQIDDNEVARPPLGRSVIMIVIGVVASIWAIASLAADTDPGGEVPQALAHPTNG